MAVLSLARRCATAQRLANESTAISTRTRQSGKQKTGLDPPRIAG
jgi:hypothetical protein